MARWTVDLGLVAYGAGLGAAAGLVIGGVGARLAMRVVALQLGMGTALTAEGTAGILIGGLVFGGLLGLVYGLFRSLAALPKWLSGALFGVLLFVLFVYFPLLNVQPGDELALLPRANVALLFGWIPFAYALAVALPLDRRARGQGTVRSLPLGWAAAFVAALFFAFVGMFSFADEAVRVPMAARGVMEHLGVDFSQVTTVMAIAGALFALTYCALCAAILYMGYQQPHARWTALLLLVFAGLAFNTGRYWQDLVSLPGLQPWWRALGWTAALAALLATAALVRAGTAAQGDPRAPLRMWVVGLVVFLLVAGSGFAGRDLGVVGGAVLWREWLLWLLMTALLAAAVVHLWPKQVDAGAPRRQARMTAAGMALAVAVFLMLWALAFGNTGWELRERAALGTAWSVPGYVLVWLCWPASIVAAMAAYGLWHADAGAMDAAEPALPAAV
jgi:hypothetical protein